MELECDQSLCGDLMVDVGAQVPSNQPEAERQETGFPWLGANGRSRGSPRSALGAYAKSSIMESCEVEFPRNC
jgi:hypothetical protein